MSVQKLNQHFGLSSTQEEERKKFVFRIENSLFTFFREAYDNQKFERLFLDVCYHLGVDGSKYFHKGFANLVPKFSDITEHDFFQTLRVVVAIYSLQRSDSPLRGFCDSSVSNALSHSEASLGIRWKGGIFYPTGEELLD